MSLAYSSSLLRNTVAVESSAIALVGYDPQRQILQVEFHDGAVWHYFEVPGQIFEDLLRADSKGSYFNRHIRSPFPSSMLRPPLIKAQQRYKTAGRHS
jgi:hypothetical protein